MPQPPAYHRGHDFSNDYADQIDRVAINNEFDGAASSINAIRHNLALIQLDDGRLRADDWITSHIIEKIGSDIEAHSSLAEQAADAAQNSAASASQSANAAAQSADAAAQSADAASQAQDLWHDINTKFTVSPDPPSGGKDGDIWFQVLTGDQ